MPPKKNSGGQKVPQDPALVLPDGGDPALVAMAIVDKKKRNLEKRKNKLESLRDGLESGTRLDKDQLAAVAKLDEVTLQLELVRDLQKQFTTLQSDFQKSRKKQQKADRLAARESEREAERRAVEYTLRVQDMLNNMGEENKEKFRTGTDGAVLLSEAELSQLDELYRILTPTRAGNSSYQTDLNSASDFIQQLMEQSTKEVAGTTYKQLFELIRRVDECGYFDRSPSEDEEEDSAEEGAADDEDYKSAEEAPPTQTEGLYERSAGTPPPSNIAETSYMPSGGLMTSQPEPVATAVQANVLSYAPSAPSPTFPGLGPSPLQPALSGGFSFMHDSEVDRGGIQGIQQPPATLEASQISTTSALLQTVTNPQITAPQMNFPQYPSQEVSEDMQKLAIMTPDGGMIPHPATNTVEQTGAQGDMATTDVTTGQPNQTTNTYQTALGNAAGGSMMNSAPPSTVYQYSGGAVSDPSNGYQSQFGAPVRVSQPARGGRGNRRGGGPPGPKGGMYRNGRGNMQGYDMQQQGSYNRGYQSSGSGYQRGGGGRPNYRPNPGARK